MTDHDADRLEARLHALVGGVLPPLVPAGADIRRGRRRLLRMRVAMASATGATLAVVLGLTGLTAGNPTATELPPAGRPPTSMPTAPSESADDGDRGTGRPSPSSSPRGSTTDTFAGAGAGGSAAGSGSIGRVDGAGPAHHPAGAATSGTGWPTAAGTGGVEPHPSPTEQLTGQPTEQPTGQPIGQPTGQPAEQQTGEPTGGASSSPSPTVTASPTATPTPTSNPTPTPTSTPTPTPTPTPDDVLRPHATLRYWNEVLATRLDPERDHLAPYSRRTGNRQVATGDDGTVFALGSRYGWDAETLQLRVATGWDQAGWSCGASYADWECQDGGLAGVTRSEVAAHDGLRQVAVEHDDGHVVVLSVDDDHEAGEQALLEAAADEQLALPGDSPVPPPALDPAAFTLGGQAQLVLAAKSESWLQTAVDRVPSVSGERTVDGQDRGTLAWSATPVYSGGAWSCLATYRNCTEVQVGAVTVHVAAVSAKAGGGVVVVYAGPSYVVRVYAADRSFPRRRAFAFVTDPDWQPTR